MFLHDALCSPLPRPDDLSAVADHGNDALIISDGGLASLIAAWREAIEVRRRSHPSRLPDIRSELRAVIRGAPQAGPAMLCIAAAGSPAASAAARQSELAGFPMESLGTSSNCVSLNSEALLRAAKLAAERGLSRVVWPIQLGTGGGNLMGHMTTAVERAAQVAQLATLDLPRAGGPGTLSIETPLLDLADAALIELALDLDAPVPRPLLEQPGFDAGVGACWWCEAGQAASAQPAANGTAEGGRSMCGVCNGCTRWREAWKSADPAGLLAVGGQ